MYSCWTLLVYGFVCFHCLLASLIACLACLLGCLFVCLLASLLVCFVICLLALLALLACLLAGITCLLICLFACLLACLLACSNEFHNWFYGYSCISIALHWFITCAISRQTNLRYQINGFTKTRMQLWLRACIYQLWCFRMLATFLAPRFGVLLLHMGFYCILLRPARAT